MEHAVHGSGQGDARRRLLRAAVLFATAGGVSRRVAAEAVAPSGSSSAKEEAQPVSLPQYPDDVMRPVNLHEFEDVARTKLSLPAYDYVAAGAADELTLRANRAAFGDYWIRRRVMVDTSHVDTSLDLLGVKLAHPILLAPVAVRDLMAHDGDRLTAVAAYNSKAILVGAPRGLMLELGKKSQAARWWAASLGHATREEAVRWSKENEEAGASALCVSFDYPYSGARDRPSRDHWESQWSETGRYDTPGGEVAFQAGMSAPFTPNLRWQYLTWVREAMKLPIVVKGITTGEDAKRAMAAGANAIIVSNHGGRTLDGAFGTLSVLPEVASAVDGKVPVLMDGGVRRGGDVVKAVALGAKAILIGRPYLWGLAAFGQIGVQRVVELLQGEVRIALGLSGTGNLRAIDRSMVRPAWKAYAPAQHARHAPVPKALRP
jgi:isopentenyl diphosphate isomerase/L-lactate dehydrogenase-like FMN-dependent dehydrogenase